MPYKKSYRRRRRPRTRYQNYSGAITQLSKDMYKLKSMINVEVKAKDTAVSATLTTVAPYAPLLSAVAQGDTNSTRDGNSIKYTSIHGQMDLVQHTSASNSTVKAMLFVDKQHDASAGPSALDIVVDSTDPDSFRNTDFAGRFQVLWSRTYIFDPEHQHKRIVFNKKISLHEKFDGTSADAASITRNPIYMLFLCNEATNGVTLTGNARLRYVDN